MLIHCKLSLQWKWIRTACLDTKCFPAVHVQHLNVAGSHKSHQCSESCASKYCRIVLLLRSSGLISSVYTLSLLLHPVSVTEKTKRKISILFHFWWSTILDTENMILEKKNVRTKVSVMLPYGHSLSSLEAFISCILIHRSVLGKLAAEAEKTPVDFSYDHVECICWWNCCDWQ